MSQRCCDLPTHEESGALPKMTTVPEAAERDARALVAVLGDCRWAAAVLAHALLKIIEGADDDTVARVIYGHGVTSLSGSRDLVQRLKGGEFRELLSPRDKTGTAENPITKMFPAAVTEERFLDKLEALRKARPTIILENQVSEGGLADFVLHEDDLRLPINVKNAGTPFRNSQSLVGLEPHDCIPIPAYKANDAVQREPNLLYAVSLDWDLPAELERLLPTLWSGEEAVVWELLNRFKGRLIRNGEDTFIYQMVTKYWDSIGPAVQDAPFRVISARKSIKVLQDNPRRTPGIGQKAWGTGASAEVNVHVSIQQDMTSWETIESRIATEGLSGVIRAVNRKRQVWAYDPEI